jgi:predicted PurR-regulated permease PerM
MTRMVSFGALIAIIVVIGLLFYKVMIGFFVPIFLAAVLCVVFRPLHRAVLERLGQREKTAAAVTTALILLSVLLPAGLIIAAAAVQGASLISDVNAASINLAFQRVRTSLGLSIDNLFELRKCQKEIDQLLNFTNENMLTEQQHSRTLNAVSRLGTDLTALAGAIESNKKPGFEGRLKSIEELKEQLAKIQEVPADDVDFAAGVLGAVSKFKSIKVEMLGGTYVAWLKEAANPTAADIDSLTKQGIDYIRPKLVSITGATGVAVIKLAIGTGIMIVAIFFFLYDGPGIVSTIMKLSPLDDRYEQELLLEFDRISRAVVLATIFSALAQGAVAGIGYYFAGLPSLVLLTLLTTVFAMVPIFGPATVWVPVCLYLGIYEQNLWAAGLLAAWGVLVVGTIDNLVKAFVLHGQSQLHPLLALMSIIGGVQALGPIGIVVGPMVVAMLQTSLGILRRELTQLETTAAAEGAASEASLMSALASKVRKRGVVTNDEAADGSQGVDEKDKANSDTSADATKSNEAVTGAEPSSVRPKFDTENK